MEWRGFDNTVSWSAGSVGTQSLGLQKVNGEAVAPTNPGLQNCRPDSAPGFIPGFVPIRGEPLLECELPPPGEVVLLIDTSNELAESLIAKGHPVQLLPPSSPGIEERRTLSLPQYAPLFRPSRVLELFLGEFRDDSPECDVGSQLPLALDLGCGSGRDAVFLSRAGYRVIAVDRDPWVLENVRLLSRRYGRCPVEVVEGNVRTTAKPAILEACKDQDKPERQYDLVLMARFPFAADTCAWAASMLKPGGHLLLYQFERQALGAERQRPRPGICLDEGELRTLCGEKSGMRNNGFPRRGTQNLLGTEIVAIERSQCEDGRPMLSVIMRKI